MADSKRWRVDAVVTEDLYRRISIEAKSLGMTNSAWAVMIFQRAFDALKPAVIKPLPTDPQLAFLEQMSLCYHVSEAANRAEVPLETVKLWLEDELFQERVGTCQDMFLESIEARLLAIGLGQQKGNWGALIAFLNAHHPQHGLKGELMSRILGDVIEQFYGVVNEQMGEDMAASMKNLLREVAEKKLIQFKR